MKPDKPLATNIILDPKLMQDAVMIWLKGGFAVQIRGEEKEVAGLYKYTEWKVEVYSRIQSQNEAGSGEAKR